MFRETIPLASDVVSYFSRALTDATGARGKEKRRRNKKRWKRDRYMDRKRERERERKRRRRMRRQDDENELAAAAMAAAVNYVFRVCHRETPSLLFSFSYPRFTDAIF